MNLFFLTTETGLHLGLQYIVRRISIRDAEILSVGKIAEFAKFAGGERRKSPDRCLFNRAKRVMDGGFLTNLLWQEGKCRLTLMTL